MFLQVLHHLRLIKGYTTGQRRSHRDVRQTLRLCDPFTSSIWTVCLVPCPLPCSLPYTYPITRCLSSAMTSSTAHLCCRWFLSLAACLHPCWIAMCYPQLPTSSSSETRLSHEVFLNLWSSVVFTVDTTYKRCVV